MSYTLKPEESLSMGIKRIILEQIAQAIESLEDPPEGDRDEGVHDARKRFKKIRAALRLVRDEIGEEVYKRENVCYRDAGRRLSAARDSYVQIETLDDLRSYFSDELAEDAFEEVRQRLMGRYERITRRILEQEEAMGEVVATLKTARRRVESLPIEKEGVSAFSDGLKRVYKRGYKGLGRARDEPLGENFHEWRKRVKYLWYHTRILEPIWPEMLEVLADYVHDLSDYLGLEHDLYELRELLREESELTGNEETLQALLGLIERRRYLLHEAAWPVGERIYAELPSDFADRIGTYWRTWQRALVNEPEDIELGDI